MSTIVVTGSSGKAGRATVADLVEHGYDVLATDLVAPTTNLGADFIAADLTDQGQTIEVLGGARAVVHLAAIPAPGRWPPTTTFTVNTAMNANVFMAAAQLGLERVVWASSETTLGLPFDDPPRYAPVDEDHYPVPATTYALSKVVGETMAEHIAGWAQIPFVGLRYSNIIEPDAYAAFPSYWPDPALRRWNLWGYIDVRDAAASCRAALEAEVTGSHNVIIAANDTVMDRPSRELLAAEFPEVELTRDVDEFGTLLANDGARALLGFDPQHSWRDHIATG